MKQLKDRDSALAWCLILFSWTCSCTQATPEDVDPIASLSTPEPSTTFGAEYWSVQAEDATSTWRQALELCAQDGHQLLPNCQTVGQVHFLRELRETAKRTSKPYDGQGGIPFPQNLAEVLEETTDSAKSTAQGTQE